jgi:REP element-mobilizing transposase RayT
MARRKIQFVAENFYHIFNRGNRKQRIFFEDENYKYFLHQLHKYFDPQGIEVISYCLMPNHFHLIIYLTKEVDFSSIMRRFSISYARSLNRWIDSAGHVFQGNFGAQQIHKSEYLTHVCRYVHLNPVLANLVKLPYEWRYSDYSVWVDSALSKELPAVRVREDYFIGASDYKRFVLDYWQDKETENHLFKKLGLFEC